MLFTACVPRNVNVLQTFINDVGALSIQIINNAVNEFFVAGNGRRGNYYGIVFTDGYDGVFAVCHTR